MLHHYKSNSKLLFVLKKVCMFVSLQAVQLLKKGGVLVYSTCTVTLAENEEQVAWALKTFPSLTLQPQVKEREGYVKQTAPPNYKTISRNFVFVLLRSLTSVGRACWGPACQLSSCASSRGSDLSWAGSGQILQLPLPAEQTGTPLAFLLPSSWKTDRRVCFLDAVPTSTPG